MTSQLIPVFNGTIDNETILLVNARELHSFLGVGRMFAHWVKERIAEYGFVENQDFVIACQNWQAKVEAVTTARNTTSPSTQPKSLRWLTTASNTDYTPRRGLENLPKAD